jgi:mono/diheme cytochrome c family protein
MMFSNSRTIHRAIRTLGGIVCVGVTISIAASLPMAQVRPKAAVQKVDFNADIRPILAANCFACHGSDPAARQAGLRLDTREGATALRGGGLRAIEPGKPDKSALVARINSADTGRLMPPAGSNHRLTPEQKRLLIQWIGQGAPYAVHWAFTPLTRPAVPAVRRRAWVRNPIDAYILARLERAGLAPSPEADRATLIRRLSLDLTGLPPDPKDVAAFVRDRTPGAYEAVVDRLLASPAYGEHWARMWLDLARYADTQGYEKDQPRTMWRYRDWVIDAFNRDMPYDRFTIEQLAGDLLPHPTDAQLLATAFNRNTMTNTEGGVDAEEFRVAAVKDRVDTTVQVWMGLTMGCAKCHSHKYDPITQQDYYRFYALFNQTEDANRGDEAPTRSMPTEEQATRLAALDAKLKGLRADFDRDTPEIRSGQDAWERSLAAGSFWTTLRPETMTATSGATFRIRPDGAIVVAGPQKQAETYTLTFALPPGEVRSIRLEALKDPSLPNGGPGRKADDPNVVTSEVVVEQAAQPGGKSVAVPLAHARADIEQNGFPVASAIDGNPDTGWAWAPENGKPHVAVFDCKTPIHASGGQLIVTIKQNYQFYQHGCLRISVSGSNPALLKAELRPLSELAAIAPAKRTPEEQQRLNEAYRQTHAPTAALWTQIAALETERTKLIAETPSIPIMRDLAPDKQRVTHLQRRGNFLDPGDVVTPAVPEAFGPLPAGAPANRLGAAEWLVSPTNALTPRVAVNRIWARLFGTGLVETEEDFGTQGAAPTHRELLDWLAVAFRDQYGWSMKRLCKEIVMSAAYRQSSVATPAQLKADPRDLLLGRSPRVRLPAEVIRDQALAASGLLSPKMYGPPVMPPQPDGLWRTVYSGLKWQTSAGEDRYRRALYTFWRRSSPYPSMTTFDAGSGEFCVVRRVRTNTPLQALVTLNDPAFVEAAGALAGAMLTTPASDARGRIIVGFTRVLARQPSEPELNRLLRLYAAAGADFRRRPDAAKSLLTAANVKTLPQVDLTDQAAAIAVANVLLNLDETLTRP